MAINPRKIKPRPARDLKKNDPKDLRNKALREANRAANQNKKPSKPSAPRPAGDLKPGDTKDLRNKFLKEAGRTASRTAAGTTLRVAGKVAGPVGALVSMTVPAGEDSAKDKYSTLKKKYDRPIGPSEFFMAKGHAGGGARRVAAETYTKSYDKKSSGFGKRVPESAKLERLRATRAALKKSDSTSGTGNTSKVGGPGAARAMDNVKTKTSSSTSTAATSAAASSKTTGKTVTVKKGSVGRQSRYERDALAMETRNRSGNRPKKSILSLFRKG